MHTMRMCARAHTHAGDTTKVRELRQRLVEEEEKRIVKEEVERQIMEEEVRMTREEADLLKRGAEEAAQKKAEGDAARQTAAGERAAREREEEARKEREQKQWARREEGNRVERAAAKQEQRQREEEERLRRESEEREQRRLEAAFPTLSKVAFSHAFKEVLCTCHSLSKELVHPLSSVQRELSYRNIGVLVLTTLLCRWCMRCPSSALQQRATSSTSSMAISTSCSPLCASRCHKRTRP